MQEVHEAADEPRGRFGGGQGHIVREDGDLKGDAARDGCEPGVCGAARRDVSRALEGCETWHARGEDAPFVQAFLAHHALGGGAEGADAGLALARGLALCDDGGRIGRRAV